MEMFLRLTITMNKVKTKQFGFRYFCRYFTGALTLRLRNAYIYLLQALFDFCNFKASFCGCLAARSKFTQFFPKYSVIGVRYMAV